ncbi:MULTISPECIES: L-seryl-tRNA(Sec) selenium transferase [unclassified Sedimentibacter]|uniref:L-seryl-tRNA(Sec) selenium transferase n=1 Tax=unclassified Sedimentibacter TaxID=2649220 RepID=UPI0027DECF55|nr:L-seryl-tRNA(Sec) selenium transferase [Sedimentibacter sp. MB35-C1]WMJ75863.1 L-seryl-tRNA(Sec) selenium transferase [Sedimentibacter sp. MB35-C1]
MEKNKFYRLIPKVDNLMERDEIKCLFTDCSRDLVVDAARDVTERLREFINNSDDEDEIAKKIESVTDDIKKEVRSFSSYNMKRVINATGTVLHTNLGRAVISENIAERVLKLVTGYSNLEYDLEEGKRGSRYSHFEKIVTKITGAEAAMAVNNNAAAVLLILSALAKDMEVVVSRGELVEIGGSFRVPDVMAQSGGHLVEVGTTNKTHLHDYESAINENTAVLLKVHTSNYRIVGFTESVTVEELAELAHKYGLPVIEDIGSGVLVDLSRYGLEYEPTVQASIKAGADIVCFSGDKLLGGPQAGVIVGKKQLIDKIKKHPLTRAFRIDKFTAIALESVFHEYLDEERAVNNIPVLKLINRSFGDIQKAAELLQEKLTTVAGEYCDIRIESCESQIGGGSLPLERIKSVCLSIRPLNMTTAALEKQLRHMETPVIGRVVNDNLILDLRTVLEGQEATIAEAFKCIFN